MLNNLFDKEFVILDGAMGTMLMANGLKLGENSEIFALAHPELLQDIHRQYIEAGSDVIYACTFGANRLKLANTGKTPAEIIPRATEIAKAAASGTNVKVGLDVGSLGELLEPTGTLKFAEAYDIFKEMMVAGAAAGADLIAIETMTDLYELKAAILAAKENTDLPIFCTMTFDKNNRTFSGTCIESMACLLNRLEVDAIGVNCSPGPEGIFPIVQELVKYTNLPLIVKANAGLPNPQTHTYDITPEEFAENMLPFADLGVQMLGGCCGTSPAYIAALKKALQNKKRAKRQPVTNAAVCSPTKTVFLDQPRIIGERLNPTGKKIFQQALRDNNIDYILTKALEQAEAGADILDVNVGLPGIDEADMMKRVVKALQGTVDLPLQIDSSNPAAIEAGLRAVNGKAIVNSVNGKAESLETILPLVKKYGAAVIGLTLDENGLPQTAAERLAIAERIMNAALAAGIPKQDIYIDCLTLTVSAQQEQANETLAAIRLVKDRLGLKTVLGVSNISFGLPNRELINKTFLNMALSAGLDLAIINPNIQSMTGTVAAFKVLANIDKDSADYIAKQTTVATQTTAAVPELSDNKISAEQAITEAVNKGLKGEVKQLTAQLLSEKSEIEIINEILIPALDAVGIRYEKEEIFLPQLINSAAAASEAFEVIKANIIKKGSTGVAKDKILLATVWGDIHDIGKNIVKVILENYGYQIVDLGRDVPVQKIVDTAIAENIRLIGLSALMTTTVSSMQNTIEALRASGHPCQIFVGGAVLTQEYADEIGADFYAKDATASVNIAKQVLG
jgi:5-methyltetrahydrofolate--homocysteine methyltransferase